MIRSLIFSTLVFLCFTSKATISIDSVYGARYTKTLNDSVFVTGDLILAPEIRWSLALDHVKQEELLEQIKPYLRFFQKNPFIICQLIVHTSTMGKQDNNLQLSVQRARDIVSALANDDSILGERILPVGKGESDPLLREPYINAHMTPERDFIYWNNYNNRIEIKITGFLGSNFYKNREAASRISTTSDMRNPAYYEDLIFIADKALLEGNYQKAAEFYSYAADVAPAHETYAAEQLAKVKALLEILFPEDD